MKQTLNLVFDVSNMMFRSLFTVPSKATVNKKKFTDIADISGFIIKLTRDICYVIRKYGPYARVIFACDAKYPWRKKLLEELPQGYKGTRPHHDDVNWDNVFENMEKLKDLLRLKGFPVIELPHTEADDIMAMLKEKLYKGTNDNSLIYVTSDEDIRQLIDFNKSTGQFVVCLNPIAKPSDMSASKIFYLTQEMYDYCLEDTKKVENSSKEKNISEVDLFNPDICMGQSKNMLNTLVSMDRTVVEVTDPADIILRKIFCGDDGDNVPAIYNTFNEKGKLKRVTPTVYKKIKKELDICATSDLDIYQETENEMTALDEAVKESMKLNTLDYYPSTFVYRQRRLVELDPVFFPKEIIEAFDNIYGIISDQFDTTYKIMSKSDIRYDTLLEGTEWMAYIHDTPDNRVLQDINKYLRESPISSLFEGDGESSTLF